MLKLRGYIRSRRWLQAVLILVAAPIVWWVSAGLRGGLVASFDVARGHYEIQSAGLPVPWSAEFDRVLRERYGIEDRRVGGCVMSMAHRAYIEGYNRVGMAAAKRHFGQNVFKASERAAFASIRRARLRK
jgi:hypothetical protein